MTLLPSNFHLSLEKMINTLKQFASFYNSSFRSRPTATLAVTNGFLSGVADVVVSSLSNQTPLSSFFELIVSLSFEG